MRKQESGEATIMVDVPIRQTEAYYDDYTLYCYSVRGRRGCVIALPFFTYDNKEVQCFEGYLIYHDKEGYGLAEQDLYKLALSTIVTPSLSGMAGKLRPLPYTLISEDKIEDALDSLIEKNTIVDLSSSLSL